MAAEKHLPRALALDIAIAIDDGGRRAVALLGGLLLLILLRSIAGS